MPTADDIQAFAEQIEGIFGNKMFGVGDKIPTPKL
jgi:hypothetical protein